MNRKLDMYLVEHKIFDSRSKAAEAIKNGNVFVNGVAAKKASLAVCDSDAVTAIKDEFVSRAAKKLQHALPAFNISAKNAIALDVSPIYGGDGNKEFLALFQKNCAAKSIDFEKIVEKEPEL